MLQKSYHLECRYINKWPLWLLLWEIHIIFPQKPDQSTKQCIFHHSKTTDHTLHCMVSSEKIEAAKQASLRDSGWPCTRRQQSRGHWLYIWSRNLTGPHGLLVNANISNSQQYCQANHRTVKVEEMSWLESLTSLSFVQGVIPTLLKLSSVHTYIHVDMPPNLLPNCSSGKSSNSPANSCLSPRHMNGNIQLYCELAEFSSRALAL